MRDSGFFHHPHMTIVFPPFFLFEWDLTSLSVKHKIFSFFWTFFLFRFGHFSYFFQARLTDLLQAWLTGGPDALLPPLPPCEKVLQSDALQDPCRWHLQGFLFPEWRLAHPLWLFCRLPLAGPGLSRRVDRLPEWH